MITCPKCSKEIADDSAHCGYCGQEIKAKAEKQTMFGMAALDGAMLQKAVQEAQAAKDAAKDAAKQSGQGVKLPKPSGGTSGGGGPTPSESGGGAGLKLPRPGQQSAQQSSAGLDDPDDMGLAQTEMLEFNDEARADLRRAAEQANVGSASEGAAEDQGANAAGFGADNVNAPTEPQAMPDFGEPDEGGGFGPQDGEFGPQDGGGQQDFGQQAGSDPQSVAPEGGFGSEDDENYLVGADDEPAKSKKGLFIIVGVVALVLGGSCFLGVGYWAYVNYIGPMLAG